MFFIVSYTLSGQTLQLSITDSLNKPIYGAEVYRNGIKSGYYYGKPLSIEAYPADKILIQSYFFADYSFILTSGQFQSDTA